MMGNDSIDKSESKLVASKPKDCNPLSIMALVTSERDSAVETPYINYESNSSQEEADRFATNGSAPKNETTHGHSLQSGNFPMEYRQNVNPVHQTSFQFGSDRESSSSKTTSGVLSACFSDDRHHLRSLPPPYPSRSNLLDLSGPSMRGLEPTSNHPHSIFKPDGSFQNIPPVPRSSNIPYQPAPTIPSKLTTTSAQDQLHYPENSSDFFARTSGRKVDESYEESLQQCRIQDSHHTRSQLQPTISSAHPQSNSNHQPPRSPQLLTRNDFAPRMIHYTQKIPVPVSASNQSGMPSNALRSPKSMKALSQFEAEMRKRYVCYICTKRFARPSSLEQHMRAHTGERPFLCEHENCGKKFSILSNLRRHQRTHHAMTGTGSSQYSSTDGHSDLSDTGNSSGADPVVTDPK